MKTLITRIKRLALALCFVTPLVSWATTEMTNPVTGEPETYVNKYTGTDGSWNEADNWDTGSIPYVSGGVYTSALVDGGGTETVVTGTSIDGWAMKLGVYGGAKVTISDLAKWTGGEGTDYATVDANSKLTIASMSGNNWNHVVNYYVASPGGITYTCAFAPANDAATIQYNLAGNGSVVYENTVNKAGHLIKAADVTLTGDSKVSQKTLVSFASTTKTFTADAAIKVYGIDGETLVDTVYLATVNTTGETTLTEESAVGSCELVQCTDGIVLYYVDGDPSSIVAKEYKPSININFTSGTALSTAADVGYGDYAVPGTSWNNLIGNNGTLSTVTQVDSTGAASTVAGVGVTISGTRGYWTCGSVTAATDLRQGYIDDAAGENASPQVVVSGIPYYSYYAVVYFSNNDDNVKFGYVTINGTKYKWDSENSALVECEGADTDSWGASSSSAWTEGGNYIVTPVIVNADGNFTIVSHRLTSARAGIAAIQIVEVPKIAADGELVINVSGDTTYTVSEDATYTTVYVTGVGTLAFDGEGAITTATLNVGAGATVPMGSSITPTTVTGAGTVVYDGAQPSTTLGFDDSAKWFGTVWVKNIGSNGESSKVSTVLGTDTATATSNALKDWGNENSSVKFTNVRGWTGTAVCPWTLILEDDSTNYAWYNNNGYAARSTTFAALKGSGTFYDKSVDSKLCRQKITFTDGSQFTGALYAEGKRVGLGGENTRGDAEDNNGTIEVVSGATATVASGKTWTAGTGSILVTGTLYANGTLAGTSTTRAVRGSGTVVFTGSAPSPTGDAWWKNASWTGTVQMKSVTLVGTDLAFNDYGNTGSVLELNGCSGWLTPAYTCTVPLKITGTLTLNNGYSGKGNAFKVGTLLGDGTISGSSLASTMVFNVTDDCSNFTGKVQLTNKCVVFGSSIPDSLTEGRIYIAEGAQVTVQNTAEAGWWGVGGIQVDGELRANSLARFGGGTNITTSDTGVFTLTSTGNGSENETDTDYARIKGTGSLKYEGTGWRALTTNNLSTAVTLVNEQSGDILLSRALTYTVGSLSGSKNFQGNYDSGSRYLNVIQSKDTEWSGKVVNDTSSRFAGLKLDASSTGTLTLSGTASQNVALEVNGGAVNLTGTWVGATTVAGTFGGTGTLTGDLTFSDGATFKAFAADDADGLVVSGTVGYPAEGTVAVDVSAIEPEADVALIKAADLNRDKFVLADGTPEGYSLEVVDGVLTLKLPVPTTVEITIPSVDNATVSVTADGQPVDIADGKVTVDIGANVVVTYTAAEGYQLTGDAISFTASASTTTVDVSNISVAAIVANVTSADGQTTTPYTSAASAIAAADDGETVTLLENTVTLAEILTISKSITIVSGNASGTTITGSGLSVYPQLAAANLTIGANVTFGSQLRVTSCDATITYPTGSTPSYRPPSGYQSRTTDNANDTSTITFYQQVYVYTAGTNVTLYDDDGNQIGASCPVAAGSTFEFTVTPADGCTLVSVTAGGVELTPSEGKYSIEIGTANVSLYAIAGAAVVTGGDSDVYCSSLQAAVDAATSGATVTLLANVTLDARVEPNLGANTTLTIDLGGYTLTREGTGGNGSVFDVKSGTVTIKNGTIDCTQDDTAIVKDGVYAITARSGSAVTLEDLTITVDSQAGACVYPFNGATVTIKSGTYKNETADEYQYKTGWTGMAVNQDNVTTQLLFIEGGKFWQVNPEEGDDSGKVTNFLAAGRIATLVDGYWTVSEGAWAAQVGSNKYTSLAAALGAATDGDTVTLLADATLPQPKYTLSKAITLNLNGKTLSAEGDTAKTATLFEVVGGKTLTVVGTTAGSTVYGRINVGNASQEGNLTIQGGYYEVGEQTVVHVNGKRTNSSVSITGATIVSTADNGIQLNGAGTHTITDTSITGATAVYLKAGSLAISGTTTLAATGAKGAVTTNNNGSDATGDALVIDNCTPPYQQITGVTIASTVTLTSANASAILVYARSGCTRQTKFVPAAVKDNITEAVATEADVFDDYVDTVPVDAGAQTDPVDTQAEAEADAAKVVPSVPAAVAAKLSDDQQTAYKALFEAKVVEVTVGESTKYAVEVALKADVVSEIQTAVDAEAEDLATAAVAAAADATNGGKATVATTPGLYYVVEAGTEPNGTAPASCTLAESGSTTLTIPNKGAKGFYKIRVSVTPVVVQE